MLPDNSQTDVQYQEIKLFIEGVQVPFMNISITSSLGQMPEAQLAIPPEVGLMEITRFYNPKVHVFFVDPIDGEEKVLFSGLATSSSMNRSADGSSAITLRCCHKNHLMTDMLLDYSDWAKDPQNSRLGNEAALKADMLSSVFSVGTAMTGIFMDDANIKGKKEVTFDNVQNDYINVSPAVLPSFLSNFKNRIIGMPSVLVNLWNQIKRGAYVLKDENDIMKDLYIPLTEQGLQFFQRMAGHYFVESKIDDDRINPCTNANTQGTADKPRLVCPSSRIFLRSAAQTSVIEQLVFSMIQNSGELVDIMTVFNQYLKSLDYEFVFLNAPAEVYKEPQLDEQGNFTGESKGTYAVDTIVKPQLPFYFSPACNVLYPSMIRNLSVDQDDYNIPTRITLKDRIASVGNNLTDTFYRGPASIREAIASWQGTTVKTVAAGESTTTIQDSTRNTVNTGQADGTQAATYNGTLKSTLNSSHGKVGKYERGRGVRMEKVDMPPWLKFFSRTQEQAGAGQQDTVNQKDVDAINSLKLGWIRRYGYGSGNLNPWDDASGLLAHERLLVLAADYHYSMTVARARAGQVETIFNPYIVTGYPMDILDSTPNHPSFHAYCTSITHNISASSISTTIGFVSAMTYTELANYYSLPVHPWLLYTLGLAESQSIVDYKPGATPSDPSTTEDFGNEDPSNPTAAEIANRFYKTTLGVGAASPTMVYDFDKGQVKPLDRGNPISYGLKPGSDKSITGRNRGELNPNLSGIGNLSLAYRNIESRDKVEERWNVKFIDLSPGYYNKNAIKINSSVLADKDKLELGESIWLDYSSDFKSSGYQAEVRAVDNAIDQAQTQQNQTIASDTNTNTG